jgi:hypothetical protein
MTRSTPYNGITGLLRSSPTTDFDNEIRGDSPTQLINLAVLTEQDRVLLIARFTNTGGRLLPVPLAISLTPAQADEFAGALRSHAHYLQPGLKTNNR